MLDLQFLERQRDHEKGKISQETAKAIGKLENVKNKTISKIEDEHKKQKDQTEDRYAKQKATLNKEFDQRVAGRMYDELTADSQILEKRSAFASLTPKQRLEAEEKYKVVQAMREATPDNAHGILEALLEKIVPDPTTRKAISAAGEERKPREIVSYITAGIKPNEDQICLLITPSTENQPPTLSEALTEKTMALLDHGEITIGTSTKGIAKTITFTGDFSDSAHGFQVYSVIPTNRNAEETARFLIKKFSQLQPKGFENAALTHRVMQVDLPSAEYFINNPKEKMRSLTDALEELPTDPDATISVTKAAEVLNYTPAGVRSAITKGRLNATEGGEVYTESLRVLIHLKSQTPRRTERINPNAYTAETSDDIRKEALQRLNTYGDTLTTADLAEVLGLTKSTAANVPAKRMDATLVPIADTHKSRLGVSKKKVRTYLTERVYTGRGWTPQHVLKQN